MSFQRSCVRSLIFALLAPLPATAQAIDVLFPPDAVINVKDYGALPDDGKDDTAAIQKAITDNVGTGRTIYFPQGTYDLSDSLVAKNKDAHWEAHLSLQGQSWDKTVLRLASNARGFGDPKNSKAVIMTGSHWEKGDSEDGGGNKAFRNNIRDLSVVVRDGNPGAIGIEWAVSNQGAIRNVHIQSGDGQGVAGIAMRRRIPGPGYIANSRVTGFDVAVDVADVQYGVTIQNLAVAKQGVAGIRCSRNLLHVMTLGSVNGVPGIAITDREGVLTLFDSYLHEPPGHPPGTVLQCAGSIMVRGVGVHEGRPQAFRVHDQTWGNDAHPEKQICWPPAVGGPAPESVVMMPADIAPVFWREDLADWQPVGPRLAGEADDTAAIQRAIDAGKPVVYFPIKRDYFISDTITIRGKVRHLLGMGVEISLGAAKEPFSNKDKPRPLFRIDPVDGDDLTIENCFFNAQYPGEVIFENNSPKPLTIKHCMGWVGAEGKRRSYQNTPASFGGKVFIEDCFLPGWRFEKQDVWARQFNPENPDGDGVTPQVANVGGTLWILGFKSEGPAPFIYTSAGGKTELLGAYNYISATAAAKVPEDAVPYVVEDSQASLTFATDNFRADSDYKVYIRQIKNGKVVKDVTRDEMPPRNGVKGDRSFVVTNWRSE